jgi:deazaflavin-dependent oxidoreductase (nitroreductase family)
LAQERPSIPRPPLWVRLVDPLARRLLSMGFPMGPNTLLTVRGRKSGQPRSAGVALVEIGERRWVVGAYGDVHWVRNLRAAGEGEIRVKGRAERVRAEVLSVMAAAALYRDVLVPYVRSLPLGLRQVASVFVGDIVADPEGAAHTHPAFELHPIREA